MKAVLAIFLFLMVLQIKNSNSITVMSIDLGTEWIKIAIVKPGVPMEIVLNKESKRKTEAAVSMKDGERLFGSSAISQGVKHPKTTYLYILDLLGKKVDNPLVKLYSKRFPYYDLVDDPVTGSVTFKHGEDAFHSPTELLAMLFNYSRSLAEEFAQQPVDTCVITVPAYFNQAERHSLMYAADLAGLKVSQLMDDNAAIALNYGVFRRNDINATATNIMFYDMGATSTSATIIAYQVVKVNGLADPQMSVKGYGFDRMLGGFEMELRLRDHLIKLFNEKKKTKSDVTTSPRAMAKLLKEARRVKRVLSANTEHYAQIEGLIDDEDFKAKVTREELEEMCSDLWDRVANPMTLALESAGLTMDSISKIILVGGGTRVPKVQEILLKESGKSELGKSLNTDEAPALGASYQAAVLSNAFRVKTFHIKSGAVYPIDIDFDRVAEHEDGSVQKKHVRKTLFQRNNPYPQRKVITFNRFHKDFDFNVNYGDLKYLSKEQLEIFGSRNISSVHITGVAEAHEKNKDKNDTESKGVKAHFRMDESGILHLEEIESVFETTVKNVKNETEEDATDPSTFQKIKESLSSLFGGNEGNETSPVDGKKEEPLTGDEKPAEDEEEKKQETEKEETKEEDEKEKGESATKEQMETEKPEKPEKKEKQEEQKSKEKKDDSEKLSEKEVKKTEKNETAEKTKVVKTSVALNKTSTRHDYIENSIESFNSSRKKLEALSVIDALKVAREVAMNSLESYIYDKQDKLYRDEYEKAMTSEEKESISKALKDASDWMFELEEEPHPDVYKDKLKDLRKLARPWLLRVKEREEIPTLLKDMETIFNYSFHFLAAIDALAPDDQIYTEVEVKLLITTLNDTINWKNETVKKQESLQPYEDNILKPDDVKYKIGSLNREVQYLLNKARTTKPKKKTEKKTNGTKTEEKILDKNGTVVNKTESEKTGDDGKTDGSPDKIEILEEDVKQEEGADKKDTADETGSKAEAEAESGTKSPDPTSEPTKSEEQPTTTDDAKTESTTIEIEEKKEEL